MLVTIASMLSELLSAGRVLPGRWASPKQRYRARARRPLSSPSNPQYHLTGDRRKELLRCGIPWVVRTASCIRTVIPSDWSTGRYSSSIKHATNHECERARICREKPTYPNPDKQGPSPMGRWMGASSHRGLRPPRLKPSRRGCAAISSLACAASVKLGPCGEVGLAAGQLSS